MDIKVLGAGCAECTELFENTKKALSNLGIDATVDKVEDLIDMVKLGVMTSPSVMANGKLIVSGRVATVGQIEDALKKIK